MNQQRYLLPPTSHVLLASSAVSSTSSRKSHYYDHQLPSHAYSSTFTKESPIVDLAVSKKLRGGAIRYSSPPATAPTTSSSGGGNLLASLVGFTLKLFNPSDFGKIFVSISFLQCISFLLSPKESILSYGINSNELLEFILLKNGSAMSNMVLFLGLCLFTNLDFESSLGYSCVISIFVTLHKLLTNKYKQVSKLFVQWLGCLCLYGVWSLFVMRDCCCCHLVLL